MANRYNLLFNSHATSKSIQSTVLNPGFDSRRWRDADGSLNMSNKDPGEIFEHQALAVFQDAAQEQSLNTARLRDRLRQEPSNHIFYLELAAALGKDSSGLDVLREGLARCQPELELYKAAIAALWKANRTEEALEVARRAKETFPDPSSLSLGAALILPILYETPDEIAYYRQRLSVAFQRLIATMRVDSPEARRSALAAVSWRANYYLAYQGQNDRELQTMCGNYVHAVMAANYAEWSRPSELPAHSRDGRIRIGYVSASFFEHSVSKFFLGWLTEHDGSRFDLSVYHVGQPVDAITREARQAADRFYHIPKDLEGARRTILADNLHILVFLELGMDPLMTQLAALRLAPIQCAAWGHPVTSGLPTIDYFFSSELMEPDSGQDHYSERLVRLPGIGVCYRKPVIPRPLLNKSRLHFGLGRERIVCWCCQSIYKYLPQHDDLFARIAKRLPAAQFAFVVAHPQVRRDFLRRLNRAFRAEGLRVEDYCVLLPRLNVLDYWNLHVVSDIFLDSLEFNGGVTTLDAVASGLPVVTLPGRFMRGRQGQGILAQLGVTETVAHDKEEYVSIAVRLGQGRAWRSQIVERMKGNWGLLFGDTRCVRALEDFFRRTVSEKPIS